MDTNISDANVTKYNQDNQDSSSDIQKTFDVSYKSKAGSGRLFEKIPFLFIIIFSVIVTVLLVISYFVAYEKIIIPDRKIQNKISIFVQGWNFMPKTPKFIIASALRSHQKITRHSFDISAAVSSDSFENILGLNQLDILTKGFIDYTDLKNPEFAVDLSVTKDFNANIQKSDKTIYFKINKLPTLLLTLFGIDTGKKLDNVLSNWIYYGTSPLETEARKKLDQATTGKNFTYEYMEEFYNKFMDDVILRSISVTEDKAENIPVYKMEFKADKSKIDYIENKILTEYKDSRITNGSKQKLSDYLTEFDMDWEINKKNYYIQKTSVMMKVITPDYSTTVPSNLMPVLGIYDDKTIAKTDNTKKVTTIITLVVKFSDFGKSHDVSPPLNAITMESYYKLFMEQSNTYMVSARQAFDTQKKVELRSIRGALEICKTKNNRDTYVAKLEDLLECGAIKSLPNDPDTMMPYVYIPNPDGKGYILKTTLSNQEEYIFTEQGLKSSKAGDNDNKGDSVNPARQFSMSNNTTRASDVNAIINALHQYSLDNAGILPAGITDNPQEISTDEVDLCDDLLTRYLAALPVDPSISSNSITDCTKAYYTGYTVLRRAEDNKITVSAPNAELGAKIFVTR